MRHAQEQLAVVGVVAGDFVARQHVGQVLARVAPGAQHRRRQRLPGGQHDGGVEAAGGAPVRVAEARLEQRHQRVPKQVLRLVRLQAHQSLVDLQVGAGGRDPLIDGGEAAGRVVRIGEGRRQRPVHGGAAGVIDRVAVGAARAQRVDQRHVADRGGGHQRRQVHRRAVIDAVRIALAQHVLEVAGGIRRQVLAAERAQRCRTHAARGAVAGAVRQPGHQPLIVVAGCVFEQLLTRLVARGALVQHAAQQLAQARLAGDRPRHRRLLEDGVADGLRLLGLALLLQAVRLLLPVLDAGALRGQRRRRLGRSEVEQCQQRMGDIGLEPDHVGQGARDRHVQRVDEELVAVGRLVGLVAGAAVVERVALQVGRRHALGQRGIVGARRRHEAEQHHAVVLQPLGLVDREHQRRAKVLARSGFVLVAQHQHRHARRQAGALVERAQVGLGVA